ncbi:MAG: hypothetical protein LBP52_03220, partial [Burkholderiaceae bacterium]|nr:hypothetical protein [Burkholderiaceae bacterium]
MTNNPISGLPIWNIQTAQKWLAAKAGRVQAAADAALAAQCDFDADELEPYDYSIRFCAGDLIATDLSITCACLIVAGNLRVKGLLQTAMAAEEGALIVLGNAEIGRYISHGAHTVICGNLHAGHVCTNSTNDCAFSVGANAQAESFAEFGEYVEIHGNLQVDKLISDANTINVLGKREAKLVIESSSTIPADRLAALLK